MKTHYSININHICTASKPPLFGHMGHLLGYAGRRDFSLMLRFWQKAHRFGWACTHAQAATDTPVEVDDGQFFCIHMNGRHLASVSTDAASSAQACFNPGKVI